MVTKVPLIGLYLLKSVMAIRALVPRMLLFRSPRQSGLLRGWEVRLVIVLLQFPKQLFLAPSPPRWGAVAMVNELPVISDRRLEGVFSRSNVSRLPADSGGIPQGASANVDLTMMNR